MISRAAPSLEAHHRVHGPDTGGINSGGRQKKTPNLPVGKISALSFLIKSALLPRDWDPARVITWSDRFPFMKINFCKSNFKFFLQLSGCRDHWAVGIVVLVRLCEHLPHVGSKLEVILVLLSAKLPLNPGEKNMQVIIKVGVS